MSTRASAARYARALFDVALQEGILDQADRDLTTVADLLQRQSDLQSVLTNAAVPAARKRSLLEAIVPRLELSGPVGKMLLLLADRDRFGVFPDLLTVFGERLRAHRRVLEAEITTAMPLSAEREAQLRQQLTAATGQQVTLTTKVDPNLIGGAVTRIGTMVYDGSLASQLTRLRERLLTGH
jgi:F-type H+-transporting ATPase subunit delta